MVNAGIVDIPLSDYLADACCPEPSFSASCGKLALQMSPLHAWLAHPKLGGNAQPSTPKTDFGSVVHELVLGNGSKFRLLPIYDFKTKAARELRDQAIADGCIPVKPADFKRANAAAEAIRKTLAEVFSEGEAEKTMIWRDEELWCRARPDWMVRSADMIFDLKLTGTNMSQLDNTLPRHIFAMWYDMTAAHYADGYRALTGRELEYRFLFVEDKQPFSIRPFKLSGQGMEMGERKLRAARSLWKRCVADNEWPGMRLSLDVADPEPWHAAGWLTYNGASEYERGLATEMQAPLEREQ